MPTYYPIDESTARTAHQMVHMSDYPENSCTESYRAAVDHAAALAESQRQRTSPYYHAAISRLLDSYARRLADWQNAYNRNQAAYPSQFIAGASGYNMRKHQKQMTREDSLWAEYDEIKSILDKIKSVGTGPVDLADPHAREILSDRLKEYTATLETYKSANAYYRKHGTLQGCPGLGSATPTATGFDLYGVPFPDFELASLRGKIKRTQARLEQLEKLTAAPEEESQEFPGGEIVKNAAENRLQIIFDDIPSPELRQQLKSSGFRWSPTNRAWQRQLTDNALRSAKSILKID